MIPLRGHMDKEALDISIHTCNMAERGPKMTSNLPARPGDELDARQTQFVEELCTLIEENIRTRTGKLDVDEDGEPIGKPRASMCQMRIEAAMRAGYNSSHKYASTESYRLLNMAKIKEAMMEWWSIHRVPYALAGAIRMGDIVMSGDKDADAIRANAEFMDRDDTMTKKAAKMDVSHQNVPLSREARLAELSSLMEMIGMKNANLIEGTFKEVSPNIPPPRDGFTPFPDQPGRAVAPTIEAYEKESWKRGPDRPLKPQRLDRPRRGTKPKNASNMVSSSSNARTKMAKLKRQCEDL